VFHFYFHVFLHLQVGWELLQPSKLWGPAPTPALQLPSFGIYENSEKPYNAYENNEEPYNAYENFGNCAEAGSVVVKTEPQSVVSRESDVSAYENLAFQCESGNNTFPPKNRTKCWWYPVYFKGLYLFSEQDFYHMCKWLQPHIHTRVAVQINIFFLLVEYVRRLSHFMILSTMFLPFTLCFKCCQYLTTFSMTQVNISFNSCTM